MQILFHTPDSVANGCKKENLYRVQCRPIATIIYIDHDCPGCESLAAPKGSPKCVQSKSFIASFSYHQHKTTQMANRIDQPFSQQRTGKTFFSEFICTRLMINFFFFFSSESNVHTNNYELLFCAFNFFNGRNGHVPAAETRKKISKASESIEGATRLLLYRNTTQR